MVKKVNSWFVLILLSACMPLPDPPSHYSIDSEFSDYQADLIRLAESAWCDAIGYCAEEVAWTNHGAFLFIPDFHARFPGHPDWQSFNCLGDQGDTHCTKRWDIYVDGYGPFVNQPMFLRMMMHEIGHYGSPNHLESGLMMEVIPWQANVDTTIDQDAVDAWRRNLGW
jgi:hypothetical protein